ncbi:MAG: hypothetical protein Q4D14_01735, partial [Bacteroidales bacterium]|nr:hypothetical protein [Bacteroidales bacterium]
LDTYNNYIILPKDTFTGLHCESCYFTTNTALEIIYHQNFAAYDSTLLRTPTQNYGVNYSQTSNYI